LNAAKRRKERKEVNEKKVVMLSVMALNGTENGKLNCTKGGGVGSPSPRHMTGIEGERKYSTV
jgi:hypothetical protein